MGLSRLPRTYWRAENGATAIEYGLIIAAIGIAVSAIAHVMGDNLLALFTGISNYLTQRLG